MSNNSAWTLTKWIVLAVVAAYVLPYILLGANAYVRIHDTLEGEWIWLHMLATSHTAFDFNPATMIAQQMKGLPRNAFPSGMNVNMLLVQLLGTYKGYIISNLLIRVIGFTGMVLLLRTHFLKLPESRYIAWFCALIFSVLPVFTPFGLSVLGQPLLLWAFLNLHERRHLIISYLLIAAFPFYSSIVWLTVPFLCLLGLTGLYFLFNRKLTWQYFAGGVLLVAMFVAANFPILTLSLSEPGFVPHRAAYNLYMFDKPQVAKSLIEAITIFFVNHYHSATFVSLLCLLAILLVIRDAGKLMWALLLAIVVICLYQGFYSYPEFWLSKKVAIINSFRFNRFHILLPFLWFFAFALALERMRSSTYLRTLVFPFLCFQLFIVLMGNDELLHNYRTLAGHQKFPNYNNYLAPAQFQAVKDYIHQPDGSYYVASFGMSPTIAQYNGFYTLDGLASIYDLRYKQDFSKIFEGEIAKSKDVQQYFGGWGNRCYIFSAELGTKADAYSCYNYTHRYVEHFDFNTAAFNKMGGQYLISAVEIRNYKVQGLQLEKVFTDPQSWWTIYLYSAKSAQ